ncbi:N-terminal Xaa-Pro-Lys N-methyltransferase 1-B-like [Corticium candelabrum]|uniref:N-terminal Xaa-Pro-Lys N-methyltransferase 1-B-like n=1 Tax=Corticium candelabrum TaxID=121492 RepID=UPI002E255A07|nr:N-terminal Xaa-Pro-Lys N-methyltransferase 1-B-like [Corticium candelabrum]XP_062504504.1 N-terminal Xaa-Pro-Lys N-methyltransferase 1-B-like [Corticium candelabrum]XP_062504506.1 N-terminal Xaa-Pro-Lys N-methyltransferase 1-B-like [Corticium candelabrum]
MNPRFLEKSKSYLGRAAAKVGSYYCCGLQSFTPKIGHYDVIWCQWVLAHLTDEDLISFVKRCQEGLTTVGIIIVKENVTTEGKDYDHVDSSVARSAEIFRQLFTAAGLRVVQEDKQLGFPEQMYDVNMWALR